MSETVDRPGPDHRADTRSWWSRFTTFEPALLRGIVGFFVLVLGMVGLDASGVGDNVIEAWTYLFALLPLIQAWWTRGAVTPAKAVVAKVEQAGETVTGPAFHGGEGQHVAALVSEPRQPPYH